MKKGIINIGHLITIGAIMASGLVGYFVNARADDKKISGVSERVVKLETIGPIIQADIQEIKSSQKDTDSKLDILIGKFGLDAVKINKQLREANAKK